MILKFLSGGLASLKMGEIMIIIVFYGVIYFKFNQNNLFYFLKFIYNINTLKSYKNIKIY